MLKIKEQPVMERPYEKLMANGASALSDAELLAIIIKTGTREETSVELAKRIIAENADNKGFSFLEHMTIDELMQIKGIGKVKAIQLKAVFELAKRIDRKGTVITNRIHKPEQVYNLLAGELRYETQEILKVITLDTKKRLIKVDTVAKGKQNSANVDIKDLFKTAISRTASEIILAHNHPSGDPTPSHEDVVLTKNAIDLGEIMDITVLDHIVIGDGKFASMRGLKLI